jgi:hypothetical protein
MIFSFLIHGKNKDKKRKESFKFVSTGTASTTNDTFFFSVQLAIRIIMQIPKIKFLFRLFGI